LYIEKDVMSSDLPRAFSARGRVILLNILPLKQVGIRNSGYVDFRHLENYDIRDLTASGHQPELAMNRPGFRSGSFRCKISKEDMVCQYGAATVSDGAFCRMETAYD
jgi:hypothetical protein